jgi:hypothetical protein
MKKPIFKLTKNIVALQKGYIFCDSVSTVDNSIPASTLQANLLIFGYMMDQDAFERVAKADLSWIANYHKEVITYLQKITGGGKHHKPLYPNFPEEVASKTDSQILRDQALHYITHGHWSPNTPVMEREVEFEKVSPVILKPCTEEDFDVIFTTLTQINTSLTPSDVDVIKWFITSGRTLKMPEKIPFKETLCVLASLGLDVPVKTTTDVLRIAVYLSGGDPALPAVPKKVLYKGKRIAPSFDGFRFKKFKRSERKMILTLLEKTNCDPKEMVLKAQRWIRLGEILHPGEYKERFPKSFSAFHAIRNTKVQSWYGEVESEFARGLKEGVFALAQRGGEYIRRLDYLIRSNPAGAPLQTVLDGFSTAVKTVSNKVLYEAYTHFEKRRDPITGRSIMIKGARKKTYLPDLPPIPEEIIEHMHSLIFTELKDRFGKLPELGNVWIDEELKKIPVPTNMRSMNFSSRPNIRGQRTPFANPDAKVIRAFVHWTDERGSEDLDLSVTYISKKGDIKIQNFRSPSFLGNLHSGDVRHKKGNCAEYVDINIKKTAESQKWAVIDVRNYNGGPLSDLNACFGFMEREFPKANLTWLPETITNTHILQSEAVGTLIAILDLETREYIYLDIDSDNGVAGSDKNIKKLIEEYSKPPAFSVYDLLAMHAEARGRIVTMDHSIDTMFKLEDFTQSYQETAKWMGI